VERYADTASFLSFFFLPGSRLPTYAPGVEKMIFSFFLFFKPKTLKVQNVFLNFLGINFWYKFCAQTIGYYLLLFLSFYNLIFNLPYMNLHPFSACRLILLQ